MIFCNMSNEKAKVSLPAAASPINERVDLTEVKGFGSANYLYDKSNTEENHYNNFRYTEKTKNYSQELSDGDFVILDGSIQNGVHLESSIKKDFYTKKDHKYSKQSMGQLFNTEGEFASYLSFNDSNKRFTLKNHQLTTYQKLTFNCEKVMVADKYITGGFTISNLTESSGTATAESSTAHGLTDEDYVTISGADTEAYNNAFEITVINDTTFSFYVESGTGSTTGTIKASVSVEDTAVPGSYSDGDTAIFYESREEVYYYVYVKTVDSTKKFVLINFDYPVSFLDVLSSSEGSSSKRLNAKDVQLADDKLFTYVKGEGELYDFHNNTAGLSTETNTKFNLTISADDDSSESRKQTYFVKVIDHNTIELYLDSGNVFGTHLVL